MLFMILIDGLADLSVPELGNKTPLEVANTPTLDLIAGKYNFDVLPNRVP